MKEKWIKDQVSFLDDVDRFERDSRIRAQEDTMARLDANYERIDRDKLRDRGYPAGSVVIIGQGTFLKNGQWVYEFYRTVLIYWGNRAEPNRAWFVEAPNEEWPDRPPWAETVGHEGEVKDIDFYFRNLHWVTGEVVEPIETWWMKEEREWRKKHEDSNNRSKNL